MKYKGNEPPACQIACTRQLHLEFHSSLFKNSLKMNFVPRKNSNLCATDGCIEKKLEHLVMVLLLNTGSFLR